MNKKEKDRKIIKKYLRDNPWGMSICVDLYRCNPKTIRDAKKIRTFVTRLCELLKMRKFGQTHVVDFGENERVSGFSMMQLIETSLISGHFANQSDAAYLDIFSCKEYPPYEAAEFCQKFFKAKKMRLKINFRK